MRNATHEASLTVRLLGAHEAPVEEIGGQVRVTIPGAVVTIADKEAAVGVHRAWAEAAVIARQAFTGPQTARRLYNRPAQRVLAAVLLSGQQPGPIVSGRAPEASPSGCGQVVVRVGRLTIVCDDPAAWDSQYPAWWRAYELAEQLWGAPDGGRVTAAARRRARARQEADG